LGPPKKSLEDIFKTPPSFNPKFLKGNPLLKRVAPKGNLSSPVFIKPEFVRGKKLSPQNVFKKIKKT